MKKKREKSRAFFSGGDEGLGWGVGVSAPNQHQKMGLRNKKRSETK